MESSITSTYRPHILNSPYISTSNYFHCCPFKMRISSPIGLGLALAQIRHIICLLQKWVIARGAFPQQWHLPAVDNHLGWRKMLFTSILSESICDLWPLLVFIVEHKSHRGMQVDLSQAGMQLFAIGQGCSWGKQRKQGKTAQAWPSLLAWPTFLSFLY